MVVVAQAGVERTFLQAVTRILGMIGESDIATLQNPSRRTTMAMRCVQDARDEVYYRTLWEFRRGFFSVDLVNGTMWYDLPSDYQEMAGDLSRDTAGERGLSYITWDQLISNWPDLRSFPPGTGVTDIATAVQLSEQDDTFGESEYYVISDGYIGLYRIPDEDFVDLESRLYGMYWKQAGVLTSDNDSLLLPQQLWGSCHQLALGKLKKALEYPDWDADYTLGTRALSKASSEKNEIEDTTNVNNMSINYNE